MNEIFERIASESSKKEMIFLAKDLSRKCNVKSSADLESLKNLAYWLYINDQHADSQLLCSLVDNEELNDVELNTWLRLLNILHGRILREKGNTDAAQKYFDKVLAGYAAKPKPFKRIMSGSGLHDDKIAENEKNNNIKQANSWRFLQLQQLCLIRELGGSETFSVDMAEQQIQAIKKLLSTLE